ncbi:MAG: hypothetical protein JRH20_10970 [Deltaproteobacteria bacterium]|nr:hypothetical protein [Deltaproteobacteria bacterium]
MRYSLILILVLIATGPVHAEGDPLLIVPAGVGDGLEVTAGIARELARILRVTKTPNVKLAYPLDRPTFSPSRRTRLARKYLRKAKQSYKVLELDSVRKSAHKALKLYKEEIKRGAKPDGYVETLHYLGAAETVDGNEGAGFKWMNDAYLFIERAPNSKISNPQVQAMYAKVSGADDHIGSLNVQVTPGALLWLNNTLHGAARGKIEIRAGLYLLRIGRPGYLTYEKWMRVRNGKTRDVVIRLQKGPTVEPTTMVQLRKEIESAPGPSTLLLATDHGAAEVLVVGAGASCGPSRCPVKMRWARAGSWIQSRNINSTDGPPVVARRLLKTDDDDGATEPRSAGLFPIDNALQCRDDVQCLSEQRCINGRCEAAVSVTRKWWFWTIIGVVAAGAGATTAILLTRPENPVLEVR